MRYLLIVLCIIRMLDELFFDVEKGRYVTGRQSSQRCMMTTIQTLLKKFVALQPAIEEHSERALRVATADCQRVQFAGQDKNCQDVMGGQWYRWLPRRA
jgi:hypothetical protein